MVSKSWLLLLVIYLSVQALAEEQFPEIIQQVTNRKTVSLAQYVDELPQLSKIYTYFKSGRSYLPLSTTVGMYQTTQKFHRDLPPTPVFAYGTSASTASFPGPTIEAIRYIPSFMTFENHLPATHILPVDNTTAAAIAPHGGVPTVVHLHAGVIAPDSDGSAFAWYTANYTDVGPWFTRKTYVYPNTQHAGNLMYHDHALGLTRINLLAGLLGAYVIREPFMEFFLNLPSGAEFDRHLIIADRSFNSDGTIYMNSTGVDPPVHPSWQPEYFGDAITVNGKIWPFLNVQRRKYRFRIINASNARYLDLQLIAPNTTDSYPFVVIGSDSSYLSSPVTSSNIVVSVAETFDVVIDFSQIPYSEIELTNRAPYPYPNGPNTPVGGPDSKVMKFVISPLATFDPYTIPSTLVANYDPANASDAVITRYITMYENISSISNQTNNLLINGLRLTDNATETPTSGTTEVWNIINLTVDNHPLHLHLAHIQAIKMQEILDVKNFTTCMQQLHNATVCNVTGLATGLTLPIPDYEKTWKNVIKIPPQWMTTVIAKFKFVDSNMPYPFDPTISPGYVYHCHILDHEDNEMIRPLILV